MAGKVGEFFDSVQMAAESGGRQFDSSGKPLVGRYRDGSMPAADKRAYGAGQMQIGTARNVAKAHNIPWDESKFLNDKDYNLKLADAHMRDLTVKYKGDRQLALAAYHSGEPRVDQSLAKYGRENFAQGLGPEGRNYIKMGGTYNADRPGVGVADPSKFLAGIESQLKPESAASQNVASAADKVFSSDEELAKRGGAIESEIQKQGGAIDVLDAATQAFQVQQMASMEQQVADTRAISNEITSGIKQLSAQVKPVFEARGRVADQLDKLNTMNPLERGLRSIFDLNYDRKYLENQLDHFDRTLQARGSDFDYVNKLHGAALAEVERRYSLDTAMPGLAAKQAEEDLGIVGLRIQQTSGMLGALKDQITTQSQMVSTKALVREDMLNRLDMPTVGKLMAQAEANGGEVQHGGVTLSYHELFERQRVNEQQTLNLEAVRMSIQSGRMDMAAKYAENLAASMTREQTEAALAAGGVWNGIQLPQDVLTRTLQSHLARAGMMAETAANTMPAQQALKIGSDALSSQVAMYGRTKEMYGTADFAEVGQIMAGSTLAIRQLSQAVKEGQPPEVVAALTARVAQGQQAMSKAIDGVIDRKVGGDKISAGYLKAFVYGTPMNQGTAAEAIIHFAMKGNLPEGMATSPEAKSVFQQTQKRIAEMRQEKDPTTGKPYTPTRMKQVLTSEMVELAATAVGESRFNTLIDDLPRVAQLSGHPLGRMDRRQWNQARHAAKIAAAKSIAPIVGVDFTQVLQMEQKGGPLNQSPEAKQAWEKLSAAAGKFNAVENQTLMAEVDDLPQVTAGRRNSSVMRDFFSSHNLSKTIRDYNSGRKAGSLSDYLIGPLSAGATEARFSQYQDMMTGAQESLYSSRKAIARSTPAGELMNPVGRTIVTLRAMPNVSGAGAKALQPVIDGIVKKHGLKLLSAGAPSGNLSVNSMMREQNSVIFNELSSMRLQDPTMELYRKNAVAGWKTYAPQSEGIVSAIIDNVSQFFDLDGQGDKYAGEINTEN